ncbi:hypothetical protein HT576_00350 [Haloterrigena sp. SYSU A121-1]|uniref:CARDB domain-containing protein n=1 Tax=Haloterrigena gelatinilytica TaxID=2741724 RepID=A0A8J8GJG3_9EURY|nr:CARDB domain-containing protein [Haloterrigena gelatinilytica]NUB89482.1 hypothetical protein [Haloterrigena gelatinilytica]
MWQTPTRRGVLEGVAVGGLVPVAATGTAAARTAIQDAPIDVTIQGTNSPVETGAVLEVTATVENGGSGSLSTDAVLVVGHDPTVVDTQSIQVGAGGTATVELTFETAIVDNDQEFPVWVVVDGATDSADVLVYADTPPVAIDIYRTNDPLATGEVLEVTARLETEGDVSTTETVELIVGHDPTTVDSATVSVPSTGGRLVTLEFETALVDNTQEFPVRVVGSSDSAERTVRVIGTNDDPVETNVTFTSCTRAEVSGTFGDGDNVAASTGFYNEGGGEPLYGNTIIEDWIEIGTHVDAPFAGTIVFEIGDERDVSATPDGARVEVPDYGDLGTVLTGITLPPDYPTATISRSNPQARSCLEEIESGAGGGGEGTLSVSISGTNTPVNAGDFLEVTAVVENTGDGSASGTVALVVGHDPEQVDSTSVSLESGASTTVSLGYTTYPAARTTQFPVRVESPDDSAARSVTVYGTES